MRGSGSLKPSAFNSLIVCYDPYGFYSCSRPTAVIVSARFRGIMNEM
jgi:hypothetical protein